jgi:CHRD domain-containing protein
MEVFMKRFTTLLAVAGIAGLALSVGSATAHDNKHRQEVVRAFLLGINETPSVSTQATGRLSAVIDEDSQLITFKLSYDNLTGNAAVAHIHFGEKHVAGGVMVFLCGGGGQPACPAGTSAEITGSIMPANVVGPTAQGITAGEFAKVLAAIRSGASYANVHTALFPAGEIRGQVSR